MKKHTLIIAGLLSCFLLLASTATHTFEINPVPTVYAETAQAGLTAHDAITDLFTKNTVPKAYVEYTAATITKDKTEHSVFKIWYNPAQKQQRKEKINANGTITYTVINGKAKMYYTGDGQNDDVSDDMKLYDTNNINISEYDASKEAVENKVISELKKNKADYTIELKGQETLNNRTAYHLLVTAKKGNGEFFHLWLDKETGILLKLETDNGQRKYVQQAMVLDLHPAFTDNTFQLALPTGI